MKHKTLLVYVPCLDGGCEDVGRIELDGHTLISDERLLDLEAAESEAIEQARLNGMGSEREAALLAKLEAAKKDRANFLVEMGRLCAQCDAAERERDECNRRRLEAAGHFAAQTALMKQKYDELRAKIETAENDAAHQKALAASALRVSEGWERKCGELRAKIEAMERQEPVGVLHVGSYYGEELQDWEFEANQRACDKLNEEYVGSPTSLLLYALPGAQAQGE